MEHATDPNLLGTFGLNWKLFLAQLLNFGVVLLILWRWVFKPVVGALEQRRQKIEDSVKKADDIEKRFVRLESDQDELMQKTRAESQAILDKTKAAAEALSRESAEEAKAQAQKILLDAKTSLKAQKQEMFNELREEVATLTVMAAEKILREKLDEQKDKKMIERVLQGIK